MSPLKFGSLVIIGLLLCVTPLTGQAQQPDDNCPVIVQTVLDSVAQSCADTGRNEACYGYSALEAIPRAEIVEFDFANPGDIEALIGIDSMELEPMDVGNETWGVAMLRLQANLPDTIPGQNVTFLVFGDVSLTNGVDPEDAELRPMQAVYFRTGIGDRHCEEAPDSGILIQTPDGAGTVNLTLNGVDVELGSTAFTQSTREYLDVFMLEHQGTVGVGEFVQFTPAGTVVRVPLGDGGLPSGPPGAPTGYDATLFQSLPLSLLPREIVVAPPLTPEQLATLPDAVPGFLYSVQPGDTLFSIARCFVTTYPIIARANNISNANLIYVGQQLMIPSDDGTIPAQLATRACAPGIRPALPTTTAPSGDLPAIDESLCDLNLCNEGERWGDGRCNDPDPELTEWYWDAGWYWACYEAGYIDQLQTYLIPPPPPTNTPSNPAARLNWRVAATAPAKPAVIGAVTAFVRHRCHWLTT